MRLLHISDIHFGTRLAKDGKTTEVVHWFKDKHGAEDPAALVQLLARSELCASSPDAVIVTGDLTWQAAPAEYASALAFLNHIKRTWPDARIVVVPGNHDVDVADAIASAARQDGFLRLLEDFHGGDLNRLYPLAALGGDDRRHGTVCVEVVGDEVIVVGVNSAASMNEKDDAIYVAPAILERVGEHLKKIDPAAKRLRILALHHHLFPFVEPEWTKSSDPASVSDRADPSIVANSAKLQEWLARNGFSIVLHGHKHTFHGRSDRLWREGKEGDHELIVIGAGSASVYWEKIAKERLHTCNVLEVEPSSERAWHVTIDTHWITKDGLVAEVRPLLTRSFEVGERGEPPWIFQADDMRRVHRAIARRCKGPTRVRNFMSVVQDAEYRHPETLRIGGEVATQQQVEESFTALHPEWKAGSGWRDSDRVDRFLVAQHKSYRIQHGPRMFGRLGDFDLLPSSQTNALRPIYAALDAARSSPTRGYLGLYNPELDVLSRRHLLPGLVGLQFLPNTESKILDVVATFRNLELSFWWAVNMFELIELLWWATRRMGSDYGRGSITIFSSSAEWRSDPRPVFLAGVDRMTADEMLPLLMSAAEGDPASKGTLREKLLEKRRMTTELNIDAVGLSLMAKLARGVLKQLGARCSLTMTFADHVEKAAERLHDAIELRGKDWKEGDRHDAVELAKLDLDAAVAQLA